MDEVKQPTLREIIDGKGIRKTYLADAIGVPYSTFLKRLDNVSAFTLDNVYDLKNELHLSNDECARIFFPGCSEKTKNFFFNEGLK